MKLYYKAGACSLSPHIALIEAGLPFTIEAVDLATKRTASGADYKAVNPRGYVPALQLDNGAVLTEGAAIVQYIADLAPEKKLAPANGTFERTRLQEWLNFISTELHKGISPNYNPNLDAAAKAVFNARFVASLEWLEGELKGTYLMGDTFTIADGYLFNVLLWPKGVGVDISKFTKLQAYFERVRNRPSVQQAMQEEGLINKAAA